MAASGNDIETGSDAARPLRGEDRTWLGEDRTWLGHPRQLARLFSVEAWERFGFYGLRTLLVLYLTDHFLLADRQANGIVGGYLSLAYLTPLVGGYIADRFWGAKRSVRFGAILMALGYLTLCFGGAPAKPYAVFDGQRHAVIQSGAAGTTRQFVLSNDHKLLIRGEPDGTVQLVGSDGKVAKTLPPDDFVTGADRSDTFVAFMLIGLSMVAVGNGLFKPNISTVVGTLYPAGDERRDAGFTIFYWGINLGSIGSQTLCPILADWLGWWAGFALVAAGMLVAYLLMRFDGGRLDGYGEPPARTGSDRTIEIHVGVLLAVPLLALVLLNVMNVPDAAPGEGIIDYLARLPLLGKLLLGTFACAIVGIPIWSWRVGTRTEARMMIAAIILVLFNVTFWTLFEQAASSLTLFADRNTTLALFGIPISAEQTQNFNSITIVIFAPILSYLWAVLARRNSEPSIPVKFGLALILVGLGFVVLSASRHFARGPTFRISLWWLVLTYFLHSIAELLISPVGLSMITKLAFARVVGMMMGVWFLSISVAEYLAGAIAQAASVPTIGGEVTNAELSLRTYLHSFQTGGLATIIAGTLLLGLAPVIRKMADGRSLMT